MEVWVKSKNHPLYMISSDGRVFSKKRWKMLKWVGTSRNFIQVSMDGKNVTLHREMAVSFGNIEVGRVWFLDNNKRNCVLTNLAWTLKDSRPQTIEKPQTYKLDNDVFKPL